MRLASELTEWKIDLYSSREWLERAGEAPLFAPLPEETTDEAADVDQAIRDQGLPTATVAVLEEAGYRTLNDVIDLEREDLLRLPGIAPEEADRIMAIIDELTTDDAGAEGGETAAATEAMPDAVSRSRRRERRERRGGRTRGAGRWRRCTPAPTIAPTEAVTERVDARVERKVLGLLGLGVRGARRRRGRRAGAAGGVVGTD